MTRHRCYSRPDEESKKPGERSTPHQRDRERQLRGGRSRQCITESKEVIKGIAVQPLEFVNEFAAEDDDMHAWTTEGCHERF